jgi:hypothetical protein
MQDYEKLGVFYLGREYDLASGSPQENLLLYDAKDLVTHAVCVGMTGSGKTGLCIGLLEEALIDGVPAIVIDPKGDLVDLMLTFPDLAPGDFRPWVNADDAARKGLSVEVYAEAQAALWRKGLAEWGQGPERIRRLRDAAEFAVYTPGSTAGIPVSILKSFDVPPPAVRQDPDLLRDLVGTTVTSLLNLVGIDADPIQSREHILLSTIINAAWTGGTSFDLAGLITAIQTPPVARIGVFDLESFFPGKDRFALAMKLNNLVAAPGFAAWLEGEPLDVDRFYFSASGKPRVSIFSIAHLSDSERMFFVSLLLTQLLGWMRTQPGTASLRTLFYMDEIFGYLPPVANPPSKLPLLTLLKQARAFGQGIVLATQNPVDLDYKALSNTGTWFIGRLQTDRDKQRVLDGLEGAAAGGGRFDRQRTEQILAGLGQRVFLMNNVHEDQPVVFQTRWVMSYLAGPLTRTQIKALSGERPPVPASLVPVAGPPAAAAPAAPVNIKPAAQTAARPALPPDVPQFFLGVRGALGSTGRTHYAPAVVGVATLYFADAKAGVAAQKEVALEAEPGGSVTGTIWQEARRAGWTGSDLEATPDFDRASFGELPAPAARAASYRDWEKDLADWLYRTETLELLRSPALGMVSSPGETERDFRIRLQTSAREMRDAQIDRLRRKYAARIAGLEDRIRRAESAVARESEQARQQKLGAAISLGATLLGALVGRKAASVGTVGRASTTMSRAGRVLKEGKDVALAEERVSDLQAQLTDLQAELEQEIERVNSTLDSQTEELEVVQLRPRKKDIAVQIVGLGWLPYVEDAAGQMVRAV